MVKRPAKSFGGAVKSECWGLVGAFDFHPPLKPPSAAWADDLTKATLAPSFFVPSVPTRLFKRVDFLTTGTRIS